ncbi:MAG: MBL fold metallo-hydrolase [Eubacteriales bacterium]
MKSILTSFASLAIFVLILFGYFSLQNSKPTPIIPQKVEIENEKPVLSDLEITVLNTGKSDCIVVQTPNKVLMIDTAERKNLQQISNFLQGNDISHIDYLIITHFDKDHVGSAGEIISTFSVGEIYEPNYTRQSDHVTRYRDAISEKETALHVLTQKQTLAYDGIEVTLLPTLLDLDSEDGNNQSIIIEIDSSTHSYLFMGDAEDIRIHEFLQTNTKGFDFIKMPHHGKWHIMLEELLTTTSPSLVAITSSLEEPPEDATLNLLSRLEIDAWLSPQGDLEVVTMLE